MTNYKLFFSSKSRFLLLLRPDVALQQNRLLGTAAAREVPANGSRSTKRISKLERKAMVEDFVNKYRVINAGKFPTTKYVMKNVGGSYYSIKTILQEVQHDFVSSAMPKAASTSTIGKNDGSTAVVENLGIPAEFDINHEEVVDNNSCQKMVDMSNMNNNPEEAAEYVSRSERQADLDLGGKSDNTSAGNKISRSKEINNSNKISESQEVLFLSSMVENTSSSVTVAVDDSKAPAMLGHPSDVTGTSENSKPEEVDGACQAFKAAEVTRVTTKQRTKDKELQESSLWGNLKDFARNIISFWRKT